MNQLKDPIKVPFDRSNRQPVKGRCYNPSCREKGRAFVFTVQHDPITCPKCGSSSPMLVCMETLIHLLVPNPQGAIFERYNGKRFQFACHKKRTWLATTTNDEAATYFPEAANCPDCLKAIGDAAELLKG